MVQLQLRTPRHITFGIGQIALTENFFHRMGLPVRMGEVAPITVSADDVVDHLERAGHTQLGEAGDIGGPQVREILRMAAA